MDILKIVKILKLKLFLNWCDKWNNMAACILGCFLQGGFFNWSPPKLSKYKIPL